MTVPLDAWISLAVLSLLFATQTWVPSEDTPTGPAPRPPGRGWPARWIVRMTVPLDALISLAVPSFLLVSPSFATQTWVPSEDTPPGSLPTGIGIVRTTVPLDASISLTVPSSAGPHAP